MPRTLQCVQFNEHSQSCEVQAWVEVRTFEEMLPTVEEASAIGNLMLIAVMSVAAAGLLIPRSDKDDD